MQDWYFTYGLAEMPYRGGWTHVVAPSMDTAIGLFRLIHPDVVPGTVNCAFIYGKEFEQKNMYKNGNFGAHEHETITFVHTVSKANTAEA